MHFVFLNQYYPPDVAPTGVMLRAVAEELAEAGHGVTVLAAAGGYGGRRVGAGEEASGNVRVRRVRALALGRRSTAGKLVDYASYAAWVLPCLLRLRPRPDVIVALTTPPFLSLAARAAAAWHGARHAHWVMDLYPDVMTAHGMLREDGAMHALLRVAARWGFGGPRAGAVLALGPDMAERLADLTWPAPPPHWVPLWGTADGAADPAATAALRTARGWRPHETVFLCSGNMGLGHCFTDVLAAARQLGSDGARLAFFGRGRRRAEIASAAAAGGQGAPELHDYVPHEQLAAHLASGDVHLASLAPAWDGTMVPSKLQGIFAAGRPVLFTGSRTSSIGRWILESGAGWVCAPGDVGAHLTAMREALDPHVRARMGAAARDFAATHFDRATNVRRIAALLEGEGKVESEK